MLHWAQNDRLFFINHAVAVNEYYYPTVSGCKCTLLFCTRVAFQKKLLSVIERVRHDLRKLKQEQLAQRMMLQALVDGSSSGSLLGVDMSAGRVFPWPLSTDAELESFESELKDESRRQMAVSFIHFKQIFKMICIINGLSLPLITFCA